MRRFETTDLVFMSDSHNHHELINQIPCKVAIHTGDCTNKGKMSEIVPFLNWFSRYPALWKVFVPGNHERHCWSKHVDLIRQMCRDRGIILLVDAGHRIAELDLDFYGAPLLVKGRDYKNLPKVNILLTHEPAKGMLDFVDCRPMRPHEDPTGRLGHPDLVNVECDIHACGHIHQSRGQLLDRLGIHRINSALCDELSHPPKLIHQPIPFNF